MKKALFFLALLALGIANLSRLNAQTTRYIKQGGTATAAEATSWATACDSLQAVINLSASGDTVLVAAGTYKGSFILKEGVTVLGGFPAHANASTTMQDRKLPGTGQNLTILDGESNKRPLTQLQAFTTPTVWEGFVIKNGASTVENINIGSIIYGNNNQPAGVIYRWDAATKSGYMVGLQEVTKQWGGYGTDIPNLPNITSSTSAKADSAGASSTALIVKELGVGDYAAYWADTLTSGGFTHWYLPAEGELYTLSQQKANINKSLKNLQNDTLKNNWYWSSSESSAGNAWGVDFGSGNVGNNGKYSYGAARAVRAFNLFNNLNNLAFCGGGTLLQDNGILRLCVVENCTASAMGGGVYANTGARVEGCLVQNNQAPSGSGIHLAGSQSLLTSSTVVNNTQTQQPQPANLPQIGDYYYTDGSYSTTSQTGKELVGLVCYINPTNPRSGWILNTTEVTSKKWDDANSWASALCTAGYNDWRQPSIKVLQTIYTNKAAINAALLIINEATQLGTAWYWSSSGGDAVLAWRANFGNGYDGYGYKSYNYAGRAVRAF